MDASSNKFLEMLSRNQPVISDGAMGTMLHAHGASDETCFDALNLDNPAMVEEIHREYIAAGSTMIQTNTFGANRFKLTQHGLADKLQEINSAGVELARKMILESKKDVLIAGDVGPLGVRIAPFGRVQLDQARAAFAEQMSALVSAGVDLILIETMADLYEAVEAVKAAKETAPAATRHRFDDLYARQSHPAWRPGHKSRPALERCRGRRHRHQLFRGSKPDIEPFEIDAG